jgi:predicted cupin superfamily sugar epimerase
LHERVAELIETLDLRPHPEGGYYREVYRSQMQITPDDKRAKRAALTTIYFLLEEGACSRWHQVDSDEVWHLYEGGPLELLELNADGSDLTRQMLSSIGDADGRPVHVVTAGNWQAARATASYVLVGCTVSPGFEFADFRMLADNEKLAAIVRSTRPDLTELI